MLESGVRVVKSLRTLSVCVLALPSASVLALGSSSLDLGLEVTHTHSVAFWFQHMWQADPPSDTRETYLESAYLRACPDPESYDVFQERPFAASGIPNKTQGFE